MTEFNLSEKLKKWWDRNYIVPSEEYIKLEKIQKEFIKRLKANLHWKFNEGDLVIIEREIDSLLGDKLK